MPFSRLPTANPVHVNTAAGDMHSPQRSPANSAAHCRLRSIPGTIDTLRLHTWPNALQRAVGPWFGAGPTVAPSQKPVVARPDLQTYMEQYNDLVAQIPKRPSSKADLDVYQHLLECRDALEKAVDCRNALDELKTAHGSPKDRAEATFKLQTASTDAAQKISQVRQSLKNQRAIEANFGLARTGVSAVMTATLIVGLAFPPALLICCAINMGFAVGVGFLYIAELFYRDPAFRPEPRAVDKWLRYQPAELVWPAGIC